MIASSVVLGQRRSSLKTLLLAKHTRGFLTNLLFGRKYFLALRPNPHSNYTGGANSKITKIVKNVLQQYFDIMKIFYLE